MHIDTSIFFTFIFLSFFDFIFSLFYWANDDFLIDDRCKSGRAKK